MRDVRDVNGELKRGLVRDKIKAQGAWGTKGPRSKRNVKDVNGE